MNVLYLKCVSCGTTYPKNKIIYRCGCGQSLDIVYDYSRIGRKITWQKLRKRKFCHWRYREFYPIENDKNIRTMEEGGTPLIRSSIWCKKLKFDLHFKYEGVNPTGSFKDRGTTVEISKAVEFGAKKLVCASTGNMGASVAAYASRAGLDATIFVPKKTTTSSKINQIVIYGSKIRFIDGDYDAAIAACNKEQKKSNAYLLGDYPYRGEGEKSVSYEIADENGVPDYVICPIGNGTLLGGMWKGFVEMKKTRLTKKLPKIIAVQASGCNTVVSAFNKKINYVEHSEAKTKASAIACGTPLDGLKALHALQQNKGYGIAVSDKEMLSAQRMLSREGVYAEMSGAATFAALLKTRNKIRKNSKIVLIATGHGLKDV
jgi:threonine synthase